MVAKVKTGENISGALNYNENKVKDGQAELLTAINYPKDADDLSFNEKLSRLTNQAALHETIEHKCVHISLNFDPSEHFSPEKYQEIAEAYMKKMGFGDQPYLVYKHNDAAHEHLHIVTTSIKSDGTGIRLHNIGRNVSNPARKEIEKEFDLIPAESKKQQEIFVLKPIDLTKLVYGKTPTKQAISNIVRSVLKYYKFASLPEFNAILSQFNVVADTGEEGTIMKQKGGLIYSVVDQNMKKVGVPIKASSIYEKPMLKEIQRRFEGNNYKRQPYKARVCAIIEDTLKTGVDKVGFKNKLANYGINVLFRQNQEGRIYGFTYIDNQTYCVYNGTDLGSSYKAKGILERLQADNGNSKVLANANLIEVILRSTDFTRGVRQVMKNWIKKGVLVDAQRNEDDSVRYTMGHIESSRQNFCPLDYKMSAYLQVNEYSPERSDFLHQKLSNSSPTVSADLVSSIVDECFSLETTGRYLSKELLEEARKKKRRRRH